MTGGPFTLSYRNAQGQQVRERPHYVVTVDGRHHSLVVGVHNVIATRSIADDVSLLWSDARARVADWQRRQQQPAVPVV